MNIQSKVSKEQEKCISFMNDLRELFKKYGIHESEANISCEDSHKDRSTRIQITGYLKHSIL